MPAPKSRLTIELPAHERGRSAYELAEWTKISARLNRGYKPHRGKTAEEQREADLARRLELETRAARRRDANELDAGIAETTTLAAARGEEIANTARPGDPTKFLPRQSGLDWLWSKGRISPDQMAAGLRYGDLYRGATDISLRSCAAGSIGGGPGGEALQARMNSQDDLAELRMKALSNHEEMVDLCDQVAGEGQRLRTIANGDDQCAAKKEAVLLIALDLLARHLGKRGK